MNNVLVATKEKKIISGQISLITVAWNFLAVQRPWNSGLRATILK